MEDKFAAYIQRKQIEMGSRFDPSELHQQFIPYFNSGERIQVGFDYGEIKRGTIGITTGWKPCFLLMSRKSARGSSDTLGAKDIPSSIPKYKRRRPRKLSHNIGSISSGTMQAEDLIPAFVDTLET